MLCRKLEKMFDLYYYDGLARQEEEIKLTIGKVVICKISLQKRQGNETRASSVVGEMRVTRARFVFVWHLIGSKWVWSVISWPITERETKVILNYLFDLNTFNENKSREYIWRHTGFSSVALSEYNWLSYAMMWKLFWQLRGEGLWTRNIFRVKYCWDLLGEWCLTLTGGSHNQSSHYIINVSHFNNRFVIVLMFILKSIHLALTRYNKGMSWLQRHRSCPSTRTLH